MDQPTSRVGILQTFQPLALAHGLLRAGRMLASHTLLLVLSQVSLLGEAGESCRTDADCAAPLACVRAVCTPRSMPAPVAPPAPARFGPPPSSFGEPPPVPVRQTFPQASASQPVTPEPPPGQFSGIHVALGVQAGAGPAFVTATGLAVGATGKGGYTTFGGVVPYVPVELRLAVLFGRFELAIEGAPMSTSMIGVRARSMAPLALSVGGLFKLYEQGSVGVFLPVRARGGLVIDPLAAGLFGGGSVGLGVRVGAAMFELKAGGEYVYRFTSTAVVVPITASATIVF
jgi:hypothetical protein